MKDRWIGAGFVRNPLRDLLNGIPQDLKVGDIDIAYFDEDNLSTEVEKQYEARCKKLLPHYERSVTNQARQRKDNNVEPYTSTENAISRWPETATSIAVTLNASNRVDLFAPRGVDDLLQGIIRPTPAFSHNKEEWHKRREKKKARLTRRPHLTLHDDEIV